MEGRLTVPNKMLGQVQGIISKYCTVRGETYTADGCAMEVALVPGDYDLLLADMNRITKGDFQFEIAGAVRCNITMCLLMRVVGSCNHRGGRQASGQGQAPGRKAEVSYAL